ncbi:MAG TPA: transglutaminase domain-containing protein [Candidatus Dormibacteraeota bacterium]
MTVAVLRQRGGLSLGDGAALTLLAMGTVVATAWAVIAAGWNEGMSVSLAVAAVAVIEAALIAGSSAGRLPALLAAPVLGVLVIVPLTLSAMPADGGPATFSHVAGRYAAALGTGLVGDESWSFIVGICAGMWALGFWTAWMAVRERQGTLALLPAYLILASNVINAPNPTATALPMVLAVAASLALLARCELAALEGRWSRQRVVALPGTSSRFTTVALVAAAGALAVGVALPPLTSSDVSGRLFHFTFAGRGGGSGTGAGSGRGGVASPHPGTIGFNPNTVPGGPLVDDPQPVLSYTTHSTETVYLRAVDDVVFDAGNWFPAEISGNVMGVAQPASTLLRDRTPADGGVTTVATPVQVHITVVNGGSESGSGRALFPGEPEAVDQVAIAYGVTRQSDGSLLTVDRVSYDSNDGVGSPTTVGTVPAATAEQLKTAGVAYPSFLADNGYLDTHTAPQNQAQLDDIRALAQSWTAGLTDNYDRARAIENHLRSQTFSYTLRPAQSPRTTEWPIHYFLLTSHAAYCQYFASSMGLMMRLLNVPTRLVSGYGDGTIDDSNSSANQVLHKISTSDAHVWVESYFPGYGWIPFEPTPASQYGIYDAIPRPVVPGSTTPTPAAAATPTPAPSAAPTARAAAAAAGTSGTGPQIPAALIETVSAFVLIALLTALLVTWVTRPRSLRSLWRRLAMLGRLLGVRRRPSETALDYAGRIAAALPPDGTSLLHPRGTHPPTGRRVRESTVDALGQIATLSGKAEFSASGLTRKDAMRWRRAWLRITRVVPLLLWRHLLHGNRAAG